MQLQGLLRALGVHKPWLLSHWEALRWEWGFTNPLAPEAKA